MHAARFTRLCALLLLAAAPAAAQHATGISTDLLDSLRARCPATPAFTAARNALANTDGGKLTNSIDRLNSVDQYFSLRLPDQSITDQKSSGRCWMFSGLNTLRPSARKALGTSELELSQAYLFFYDKLEKANMFLEAVIRLAGKPTTDRTMEFLLREPVQDGGNWLGFIELVKKYGVVPRDVMPETYSTSNSRHVNQVLGMRLRKYALALRATKDETTIASLKTRALEDVYKILAMNFGVPPVRFAWRYQHADKSLTPPTIWTPQQFYKEFIGLALDDYVALYSIPTLPFLKKYEIELDKAVEDRPTMFFVNVPLQTLKDVAFHVLTDSTPVWFGCDVGREANTESGLLADHLVDFGSLYGMDFTLTREELFETYQSTPGHNMVFTGVDIVGGKPAKWLVENSWGEKAGMRGYLTMTDDWFDKYVQVVAVNKKYVPKDVLEAFRQAPVTLPVWDPMYLPLMRGQ